ncbi:2TM domain-containing protein [Hyphomicrobium sp.]|uniref:2TM domain-containing protein n=1 Tax=Hyphomicrobium sp. TaxID=82 RepID=UPI0025B7E3ED|nr:2TM domain-containing protein [Hyphomicrobium sp.]
MADKKLGFRIHAIVFVLSMVLLFIVNMWIGPPYWALWVLLGWGVGLLAHWWFGLSPSITKKKTA